MSRRPNVLLLMADQQKATSLSLYGNPDVRTPALEALAARGVLARHCLTPQPFCFPSRCSLLTGRYPHAHGVRGNGRTLVADELPLAEILQREGYHTGAVGHFHGGAAGGGRGVGVTFDMSQGRQREAWQRHHQLVRQAPARTAHMTATVTGSLEDYIDCVMTADAARFLDDAPEDAPFFLEVAWIAPHPPYFVPEPYASQFDPAALAYPAQDPPDAAKPAAHRDTARDMGTFGAPETELRRALAAYYAMVSLVDDQVARLLEALRRRGQLDNTIVVYTSDHGDYAGEHGMWGKSCTLYDALVRVPLIMAGPGIPSGGALDGMVQSIDVLPTLLGLLGLPVPDTVHGLPLQALWGAASRAAEPKAAPASSAGPGRTDFEIAFAEVGAFPASMVRQRERGNNMPFGPPASGRQVELSVMARTADWKLVYTPGRETQELYDLQHDPWERRNCYGAAAHEPVVAALRQRLQDWMLTHT